MKKDLTLVVLAAGMGSRFGGLKQIEPVGPNGEFIVDYSIFDAIKCGFNKVVFIIKEENLKDFEETVGNRLKGHIQVEYAFQDINDVPVEVPEGRVKPWGTTHALNAAREKVHEPFVIINADDFYGHDAFKVAADFLNSSEDDKEYAMVGYQVKKTLSPVDAVKRGVADIENGYLNHLIESKVKEEDGNIIASPLDGREPFEVEANHPVSMTTFCLKPNVFEGAKEYIDKAFAEAEDLSTMEVIITDFLDYMINQKGYKMKVLSTTAVWHGMTYKEDKDELVREINHLIDEGQYPTNLWK